MVSQKLHTIDMTEGPFLRKILSFALPLAASSMLQLFFNAADVIVVGKFSGSTSLAAVGATTTLINLLVNLFIGISVGVNVVVARQIGCRDESAVRNTVHAAFGLGIILAAAALVTGLLLSAPMLRLMGTPESLFSLSSRYLRIYFLGVPAQILYNFGAAVLRAYGDTRKPFLFLSISGIVNVVLNLIFVIVLRMDVAGVAIATAVSQLVSMVLVICYLRKVDSACRLHIREIRIDRRVSLKIIQIGLPAGLNSVIFNISNTMIQSAVNSFGPEVIAANTAAASIGGFIYTSFNSVFQAAISFTSQTLGSGKHDRLPRICKACLAASLILCVPLSTASWIFGRPLLGIYVSKSDPALESILASGMIRQFWVNFLYPLCGIMEIGNGMVRGLGRSWLPTIVSVVGSCLLRIVWLYTVFERFHTYPVLLASYPISWIVTFLAHFACFIVLYRKIRNSGVHA